MDVLKDECAVSGIYKRYVPGMGVDGDEDREGYRFIFKGNLLLVSEAPGLEGLPFGKGELIDGAECHYMGELAGKACFYGETAEADAPNGMVFKDLRAILEMMDEDIFLVAGRAFQLLNWRRTHRFCGRCGAHTVPAADEQALCCEACKAVYYPKLSPAIIAVVVDGERILLAHNKRFRAGYYSVVAGFVEPGETFEDCVRREIMEEVGIRVGAIRYFSSQPWPFPDSLMIGFVAEYMGGEIVVDGKEIASAGWYTQGDLPDIPPATTIAGRLIRAVLRVES